MLWGYFASCLNNSADTFIGNSGLFSKVYFPRLSMPISKIFSNLVSAGIQFATLICFYIYYAATGTAVHRHGGRLQFRSFLFSLRCWGAASG